MQIIAFMRTGGDDHLDVLIELAENHHQPVYGEAAELRIGTREKSARQIRRPVMPGLEPGIQAAPYIIITRLSALDARVKPVHDEFGRLPWTHYLAYRFEKCII